MKHLLIILCVIMTLGVAPTSYDSDDTLYHANLPEISVVSNILEDYVPSRGKNRKEFLKLNRPLLIYIAKHTWLTEAQAASFLVIEQGLGSELLTKHNNPFNVKGKGVLYKTWEYTPDNKVYASFRSYKTIEEGVSDFIRLINSRYATDPLSNSEHSKHLYTKGYFTDPNYYIRTKLANDYENMIV